MGSQLIRKVYEVDPLLCPDCESQLGIVAFLIDLASLRRRLAHLGFAPVPGAKVLPSARDLHPSPTYA